MQSQKDKSFYIGSTSDLENRMLEHNYEGLGYTSKKRPWKVVYTEKYEMKPEALKREKHIKRLKSRKYIEKLIGLGP